MFVSAGSACQFVSAIITCRFNVLIYLCNIGPIFALVLDVIAADSRGNTFGRSNCWIRIILQYQLQVQL